MCLYMSAYVCNCFLLPLECKLHEDNAHLYLSVYPWYLRQCLALCVFNNEWLWFYKTFLIVHEPINHVSKPILGSSPYILQKPISIYFNILKNYTIFCGNLWHHLSYFLPWKYYFRKINIMFCEVEFINVLLSPVSPPMVFFDVVKVCNPISYVNLSAMLCIKS